MRGERADRLRQAKARGEHVDIFMNVRPLIVRLSKQLLTLMRPGRDQCIDEAGVACKGRVPSRVRSCVRPALCVTWGAWLSSGAGAGVLRAEEQADPKGVERARRRVCAVRMAISFHYPRQGSLAWLHDIRTCA